MRYTIFFNMERDEMRSLQSQRLKELVNRVYHQVPFYRMKMDELGVKPEDIQSIDDIIKLPFTYKTDLRDHYPFGLFAAPMKDIVRIHEIDTRRCRYLFDLYPGNSW